MAPERKDIEKALQQIVVPKLREMGFKGSFPHYRRAAEDGYHLFSFFFDPSGGSFVAEAGKCTEEEFNSIASRHENLTPKKLDVGYCPILKRRRLGADRANGYRDRWFKFAPSFHEAPPAARKPQPFSHFASVARQIVPLLETEGQEFWRAS
jgi:hypothetical protein